MLGPLMYTIAYIDRYLICKSGWLIQKVHSLNVRVQPVFSTVLRFGVSIFFVCAAFYGIAFDENFILTPDLKTPYKWMVVHHLAIALLVLFTRTAFLAGIGIAALYVYAVFAYGVYHLLDYPIFIGVAAYLVIEAFDCRQNCITGQTILRLCTATTLLWAAIEKFAFPEWSFSLLNQQPDLGFGLNTEFYMVAAGFVELCAAYLLITGMLSSRVAAIVLLFFFVSAIYYFGLIDAIGHCVIIVVLFLLALSHNPLAIKLKTRGLATTALAHTGLFFATMFALIAIYCGSHYLSYWPYAQCAA